MAVKGFTMKQIDLQDFWKEIFLMCFSSKCQCLSKYDVITHQKQERKMENSNTHYLFIYIINLNWMVNNRNLPQRAENAKN